MYSHKISLLLCILILLVGFSSASTDVFKVGDEVTLETVVHSNGTFCNDCICEVSIYNTSESLVVNNQNMTYSVISYQYNYNFTEKGNWKVVYNCSNSTGGERTLAVQKIPIQEANWDTVNQINTTVSQLENTNLSSVEGNLTKIINNQVQINGTVNQLNSTVNQIENNTNNIISILGQINDTVNNLTFTVENYSQILNSINQTVTNIDIRTENMSTYLNDTYENTLTIIWYMWDETHSDNWNYTNRTLTEGFDINFTGINSSITEILNLAQDINATTYDTYENTLTIIWYMWDTMLENIWEDYDTRMITDRDDNPIDQYDITNCTWNEEGSGCENYKEIDNRRT